MLIGREPETRVLERLIEDARVGRAGTLVIRGDPGVGKTALLDYALQRADRFELLHVVGIESEADLPYAGLHALLRPLVPLLEQIPQGQGSALRVALALEPGEPPDRLTVGAGALSLLAEAAEHAPVLAVVDDAHWLDRASTDALTFAARRLAAETVAVLFAARTGERRSFEGEGLDELDIQPLSTQAARAVLRERFGRQLSDQVAGQLAVATGGNPLALVEVPGLLSEEERLGKVPLQDPLPVSQAIEERVCRALRSLPESSRRALLLAASDDQARVSRDLLLSAEDAGLLRLGGDSVSFRHPLFRAAVYHAASPAERRSAHRELAEHFDREEDADRRAWHLAAAAEGANEAVAATLEAAAGRFAERSGHTAQSRALERAAELSETPEAGAKRLLDASHAAHFAGNGVHALELSKRAKALAPDPLLRSRALQSIHILHGWLGVGFDEAEVEREARELASIDLARAAKHLRLAAVEARIRFDFRRALALTLDAVSFCARARVEVPVQLAELHVDLLAILGRPGEAEEVMAGTPDVEWTLVWFDLWQEQNDAARDRLVGELETYRAAGNSLFVMLALGKLGELEFLTGRFAAARAAASERLALAEASGYPIAIADTSAALARIAAVEGREAEARAMAERALGRPGHGYNDPHSVAQMALGLLELGLGRPQEAIAHVRPVAALAERSGMREPGVLPYGPDLIEAYARAGDEEGALRELQILDELAQDLGRQWALAAVARLRGFLGPEAELDKHFEEALARHAAGAGSPFDEARTELLYGERLRRAKRRVDAREHLRRAVEQFDSVGAAPWSERARAELQATGERVARRDPTAPEKLTPQELRIALQVSEGKTNPEIGAALFLSRKTVEYHLTHVYRKLDLHSRAELIRLFAADAPVAGPLSAA